MSPPVWQPKRTTACVHILLFIRASLPEILMTDRVRWNTHSTPQSLLLCTTSMAKIGWALNDCCACILCFRTRIHHRFFLMRQCACIHYRDCVCVSTHAAKPLQYTYNIYINERTFFFAAIDGGVVCPRLFMDECICICTGWNGKWTIGETNSGRGHYRLAIRPHPIYTLTSARGHSHSNAHIKFIIIKKENIRREVGSFDCWLYVYIYIYVRHAVRLRARKHCRAYATSMYH